MDEVIDARRALLGALFDDAGLFPPASLPMTEAAAGHEASRDGPYGWMLGRFVCPASRLHDLGPLIVGAPWRLSAILDAPDAPAAVAAFARETGERAHIEALETPIAAGPVKAAVGDAIDAARATGLDAAVWVEVPAGDPAAVEAVASHAGAGVKIRLGGAGIPSGAEVARTIVACRDARIVLKATAGLHHPRPIAAAVTGAWQHGFLNLLAAAALAFDGAGQDALAGVVETADPEALALDADGFRVSATRFDAGRCAALRRGLLAGIGSCSLAEPVEDLEALGVLPL